MASDQTVWNVMGKALWDPHPTGTDLRARQLAAALGYPLEWRVVRTITKMNPIQNTTGGVVVVNKDESHERKTEPGTVIVDRIYAGKPGTGCDMWFHHQAAMEAAQAWTAPDAKAPTPFDAKGGHLLPRLARFSKGDKVQVLYENEWWDAKILRRKEHTFGFGYQVQYAVDSSKQSGVEETNIRPRSDHDPAAVAVSLGLAGWKAFLAANHRYKIVAPNGTVYTSKKAALDAYKRQDDDDEGDPPWRKSGHEFLGRHVRWTTKHKASARRTVRVEQIGQVVGWIQETDVDKAGEPGFVSEKTGQPARLFHVVFDDEPSHPYASVLVQSQDLEEYELLECLISEEEYQPRKKARTR